MFRYVGVLLLALALGSASVQAGWLAKSGAGKAVGKAAMVGAFAIMACFSACDEQSPIDPGQVADVIDSGDDDGGTVSDNVIKIGMNYLGDRDPNSLDGAELAVAQINEAGGVNVNGTLMLIELLSFDNEKNITRSIEGTNFLIAQGVKVLIGPEYSSHAATTGKIANEYKIPMISTTATNPKVATSGKYVFMGAFTDSFQGLLMAKFARQDLQADTAAILTKREDTYSEGLSEKFQESFGLLGGQVVAQQFYVIGATDFTAQLNAIAAKKPDVLFIPGHAESALAAKQARELGLTATFLGGDGWGGADLIKDGGVALEGSYFSDHFYTIPTAGLSEDTLQFIADFIEMHGKRPISRSALGFDTVYLAAEAIERAGSLDGEAIRDEIAATREYSGATFLDSFSDDGHANKVAIVKAVKDGGVVFFKLVSP